MSIWVGAVVLAVGGMVAALVIAVVVIAGTRSAGTSLSDAASAARRHAGAVTGLAWLAAVVALLVGAQLAGATAFPHSGVMFGLLPALAGLAHAGVHAIGEVTWPGPTGAVRRAALTRRTARDVASPMMTRATATWLGALVVVAVVGSLTAAPDGRSVAARTLHGSSSASPYPGWHYSVPLLAGTLVVVAAAVLVLRLVASRPAVVDAAPEWDLQMRRLSAHRVLRGTQLTLGLTAAGQLLAAGMTLRNVAFAGSAEEMTPAPGYGIAANVCLLLALGIGLAVFAFAAVPGPEPRAPRPDALPGPAGAGGSAQSRP